MNVLRMTPWWRGPALLVRRPGVLLALTAAAAVATVPAAAAGPFLSSSRNATLHHQVGAGCPFYEGARITSNVYFGRAVDFPRVAVDGADALRRRTAVAADAAARVPGLGAPEGSLTATVFGTGGTVDSPLPWYLVTRPGYRDHLQVLDGPRGSGAWLPDRLAEGAHLRVGDTITLATTQGGVRSATVTIAAVYRDLRYKPDESFWCSLHNLYRPPGYELADPPPPMVLLDEADYVGVAERIVVAGRHTIEYPLANPDLDQDAARRAAQALPAMRAQLYRADPAVFATDRTNDTSLTSELPGFAARADLSRTGMFPGVVPITVVGVLVGLLVVAAAGAFWIQRRRTELMVLAAHGVGAGWLGVKAVAETLPALVAGTTAGWGTAWVLVRWFGPDPVLSGEAAPLAAVAAGTALAAQILTMWLVTGLACRRLTDGAGKRHRAVWRVLPWELAALGVLPLLWRALGSSAELADTPGGVGAVVHVPARLLVVPIVAVLALTVFGGEARRRLAEPAWPAARTPPARTPAGLAAHQPARPGQRGVGRRYRHPDRPGHLQRHSHRFGAGDRGWSGGPAHRRRRGPHPDPPGAGAGAGEPGP
jgi:putative ABC transport system permease protein